MLPRKNSRPSRSRPPDDLCKPEKAKQTEFNLRFQSAFHIQKFNEDVLCAARKAYKLVLRKPGALMKTSALPNDEGVIRVACEAKSSRIMIGFEG